MKIFIIILSKPTCTYSGILNMNGLLMVTFASRKSSFVCCILGHLLFMVLMKKFASFNFGWLLFLISVQLVYPSESTEMLSEEVLGWMAQGLMWFNVTTANNPKGYLNGSIPPLERNKCAQPSYVSHVTRTPLIKAFSTHHWVLTLLIMHSDERLVCDICSLTFGKTVLSWCSSTSIYWGECDAFV